jgi:hypothetical protein
MVGLVLRIVTTKFSWKHDEEILDSDRHAWGRLQTLYSWMPLSARILALKIAWPTDLIGYSDDAIISKIFVSHGSSSLRRFWKRYRLILPHRSVRITIDTRRNREIFSREILLLRHRDVIKPLQQSRYYFCRNKRHLWMPPLTVAELQFCPFVRHF